MIGEDSATVYVTDRESRDHRYSELPGTVEDAAEEVTGRGGRGIPVTVEPGESRSLRQGVRPQRQSVLDPPAQRELGLIADLLRPE